MITEEEYLTKIANTRENLMCAEIRRRGMNNIRITPFWLYEFDQMAIWCHRNTKLSSGYHLKAKAPK